MAVFSDDALKGLSFQFLSARRHRTNPGWEMKTRLLMDNMLFYVLRGNIESKTLGRRLKSGAGGLLLFRRGTLMTSRETTGRPFEVIVIHFQCTLPSGEDFFSAYPPPADLPLPRASLAREIVLRMAAEEEGKAAGWHNLCQSLLGTLVFDLIRRHGDRFGGGDRPRYSSRVERALRFVKDRVTTSPPVLEIARAAGLSEAQFRRVFSREVGLPPLEYLIRLKISEAIEAKKTGDLTWDEIAERLGFSSVYYFYRVFKRVCGRTPGNFLRKEGF
jgi:AraC-like DNA-binding protein